MGYCNEQEIDNLLATALTSATNPTTQSRRNLLQIGAVRDKNVIPDDVVQQYIQWAGHEIDATLSQLYQTPICELADFETLIYSDIDEYNDFIVLEKACPLTVGDTVVLIEGDIEERHSVFDVISPDTFQVTDPIMYAFTTAARVLRVKFPDPIPWICARLAVASIFDKYYSAQVSPNVSDYGKTQRNLARQKIDDILNGRAILHGVRRIGRRLYDPNITEQYDLPNGQAGSKDIDNIN